MSTPGPLYGTKFNTQRYKSEICQRYLENGSCKYGEKCQFAHGEQELRYVYKHPKYKTLPCKTFHQSGKSNFIQNPEKYWRQKDWTQPHHLRLRLWVFWTWFLGVCSYGNRCNFLHAETEEDLVKQRIKQQSQRRMSVPNVRLMTVRLVSIRLHVLTTTKLYLGLTLDAPLVRSFENQRVELLLCPSL